MSVFVPAEPIPPGEYLQDEIDARGWTHADLADVLNRSRRQIVNLVSGKSAITPGMAVVLAQAFNQNAKTWMDLQVAYELARKAKQDRDVALRATIYDKVPVREIIRRGWIKEEKNPELLDQSVCQFLRIPSITDAPDRQWAARKSGESPAQDAWFFRAKQLAECVSVFKYSPKKMPRLIERLKHLMLSTHAIGQVPKLLAEFGIRFVVVETLKGAKIDGAAFGIEGSPAIALTLRYDRIDNFWFTLMHEISHVSHKDCSLDVELMEADDATLPDIERRANKEAAEMLIPPKKLDSFVMRCGGLFYQKRIVEFAHSQHIHPGIVVGQLRWRREIAHSQFWKLLDKIRSEIVGQGLTDGWGDCPTTGVTQ